MATIEREVTYRCSDDCMPSGCPGHKGRLVYQSTADSYMFNMNGMELHFERGELDAMISLLSQLGRVDCVQVPPNVQGKGRCAAFYRAASQRPEGAP